MTRVLLMVAALAGQRLLQLPGTPGWFTALMLPMVLVVAPRLRRPVAGFPWEAIALGLAWDITLEPVIGPGGIAWSVAALAVAGLARVVADRSPAAWFLAGAAGAVVVVVVRFVAELPLGLASTPGPFVVLAAAFATGAWCGAVGAIGALGLPERWRRWRARRLR